MEDLLGAVAVLRIKRGVEGVRIFFKSKQAGSTRGCRRRCEGGGVTGCTILPDDRGYMLVEHTLEAWFCHVFGNIHIGVEVLDNLCNQSFSRPF